MRPRFTAWLFALNALVGGVAATAHAQEQVQKVVQLGGQDVTMTTQSYVVASGNINDVRYSTPVSPAYNGVGSILVTTRSGSAFLCTGSLLADGKTVLTAAHCLTPGGASNPTTAISVNFFPTGASTPVTLNAASWNANPLYTGKVIDENDVAVLHLGAVAPSSISRYDLASSSPVNSNFEFIGFGLKGSSGLGTVPGTLGLGLSARKQGANTFDIYAGDVRWEGFWDDPAAPSAHVLLSDFDNGTTGVNSNDAMCWIGQYIDSMGGSECHSGLGLEEANTAGGDSGGPGFVDGRIASVTSFGLTFGQFGPGPFPDIDKALNSSFGEFAGFTDVSYQSAWITSQMDLNTLGPTVLGPTVAPEPESLVLLASGLVMIGGLAGWRRLS
jgi:secreted trypsin-like serine protease